MKKLLLTLTLLVSPALFAANIFDAWQQFISAEKMHKDKCFDFEKMMSSAKIDLLKKQHDEKYDMEGKGMQKFATILSRGFTAETYAELEKLSGEKLATKIAMCGRHLEEWKALCDHFHQQGEQMYNQAKSKLNQFRQSLGMGASTSAAGGYKYGAPEGWSDLAGKVLEQLGIKMPTR